MRSIPLAQFVAGLRDIPEEEFTVGTVYDYLKENAVAEDSLQPFLFFSRNRYTRNLIFKNHLFELLAICWDVGQESHIHNHYDQNCWMTIPTGRLRVRNFRVLEQDDATNYCRIEPTDAFDIHRLMPAEVDPGEPVHQVANLAEFNQPAISLHIYSRPFDRCLVYAPERSQFGEIQLRYTSEYGRLCAGETL